MYIHVCISITILLKIHRKSVRIFPYHHLSHHRTLHLDLCLRALFIGIHIYFLFHVLLHHKIRNHLQENEKFPYYKSILFLSHFINLSALLCMYMDTDADYIQSNHTQMVCFRVPSHINQKPCEDLIFF